MRDLTIDQQLAAFDRLYPGRRTPDRSALGAPSLHRAQLHPLRPAAGRVQPDRRGPRPFRSPSARRTRGRGEKIAMISLPAPAAGKGLTRYLGNSSGTAGNVFDPGKLGMLDQVACRQVDRRRDRGIAGLPFADGALRDPQQRRKLALGQSQPLAALAQLLPIHATPLIFQGQPGELVTPPAPCPYRRIRSLNRSRFHLRDRRRWIFIRLSLVNRGGQFPRGTTEFSGTEFHFQAENRNQVPISPADSRRKAPAR